MTAKNKQALDRWLPSIITIAVLGSGGLISYGRLTAKMETMEKELYYLRQRIDAVPVSARDSTEDIAISFETARQ